MAVHTRFELISTSLEASFARNHQAVQGGYSAHTLGRSMNFKESADDRKFVSVKANLRGSVSTFGDVNALSHCLMLEPIVINDQRNARFGDLRRVLGFFAGSSSEDNSFGTAHFKNSSPGVVEELKRLIESVADTYVNARPFRVFSLFLALLLMLRWIFLWGWVIVIREDNNVMCHSPILKREGFKGTTERLYGFLFSFKHTLCI